MRLNKISESGTALLSLVITMPFLMLITIHYMQFAAANFGISRTDQYRTYSQMAADAGVDYAVQEINKNPLWIGTVLPVVVHDNNNIKTQFTITSLPDPDSPTKKIITSTAETFSPANSSAAKSKTEIEVKVREIVGSEYSVVAGPGGLIMENNAKILGGDVHVNGGVLLKGNSTVGLSISPVKLDVANHSCPKAPNHGDVYPVACQSTDTDPIVIENANNNNPQIYGDVSANYQESSTAMVQDGLISTSGVAEKELPSHDRAAQKAAVNPAATITPGLQLPPYNGWECNGGIHTWPANIKINGDVRLRVGCQVILLGDAWITGKLEMHNSSQLIVSDLAGQDQIDIMIDGEKAEFRNASGVASNTLGTGARIITYWNATGNPDTAPTGLDLHNSTGTPTIELHQSASGPKSIFYAKWSKVLIVNSGSIGALAGQTVHLKQSGAISFGTSAGPGSPSWVIDSYKRLYN